MDMPYPRPGFSYELKFCISTIIKRAKIKYRKEVRFIQIP